MSETIVVAKMVESRFGPVVIDAADRVWNFSPKYVGERSFEPGTKLDAEVYISQKGKFTNRYLNSVKVIDTDVATVITTSKEIKKKIEKDVDNSMSKAEWQSKDRRISRQGCIQVAVQVMGDWDKAVELADKMLEYVNEVE